MADDTPPGRSLSEKLERLLAATTPKGKAAPTTRELAAALTEKIEAARTGTVTPADLSGGTFTVNNYGPFGVDGSAAIINHPEVAIVAYTAVAGDFVRREMARLHIPLLLKSGDVSVLSAKLRELALR